MPQPNVLIIFTDQQRWDTVGAYGNPMELTPCLDELAADGVRLEYCFSNQPICSPARGCIQTGQYATTHGVWCNARTLPADTRTLAHWFGAANYDVGYIGKWHLSGTKTNPVPLELRCGYTGFWEAADILEFTSSPYQTRLFDRENNPVDVPGYRADAVTDRAIHFITQPRQQPFFCFLALVEPHHQNQMHRFVAPDGYAARYTANPYIPPDLLGKPGDWFSQLPDYYGQVARIDENLARLVGTLRDMGQLDNTIIVFTSDHGCHFRTRNVEYKRSCHESSIRVPAVIHGPGFPAGTVVRNLVSLVDIAPTLLEACGLPVPDSIEGHSFLPLAQARSRDWTDEVFVQISETEVGRALRTPRWKYSVFAPELRGSRDSGAAVYVERYLYDLYRDPYEQVNLVGRKDHNEVAAHLRQRLTAIIEQVEGQSVTIEPARYPA